MNRKESFGSVKSYYRAALQILTLVVAVANADFTSNGADKSVNCLFSTEVIGPPGQKKCCKPLERA